LWNTVRKQCLLQNFKLSTQKTYGYRMVQNITRQCCGSGSVRTRNFWSDQNPDPEPVFVNVYGAQESIPPAHVARRASTTNRVFVPSHQTGNRYMGSVNGIQIRAQKSKIRFQIRIRNKFGKMSLLIRAKQGILKQLLIIHAILHITKCQHNQRC